MYGFHEFVSAFRVGGAVMYPLLALAVAATVVVLEKAYLPQPEKVQEAVKQVLYR